MPTIGADAYTVFSAIISHAGKSDVVWPGIERLKKMCTVMRNGKIVPMPEKRLYAAITVLLEKGLAERFQERKENGDFGRRKFRIGHDLVGVTQFGDKEFFEGDSRLVENGEALNGEAINGLAQNDQTEEIPKREELPKIEELPKREVSANESAPNLDYFSKIDGLKKQIGPKHYDSLNEVADNESYRKRLKALWVDGRFSLLMDWLEHRKSIRKHATPLAIQQLISTFEEHTPGELSAAVKKGIESGHIGIFPKKERAPRRDQSEQNLNQIFGVKKRPAYEKA